MQWFLHFCATHWADLGVAGLCIAGLVVVSLMLARLARVGRPTNFSVAADETGGLTEEMVLVFPLFLLFLGLTVEMILMLNARLVVNYAAFVAGRSASVWIPSRTSAEPANTIQLTDQAPSLCGVQSAIDLFGQPAGSPTEKLDRIRGAAALASAPVSPNYAAFCGELIPGAASIGKTLANMGGSLLNGVPGAAQMAPRLMVRWLYARDYTRVWFNDNQDARTMTFAAMGDIKVTVEHDFYMTIPFLGRAIGKPYLSLKRSLWYLPIRESYVFRNEGEPVAPGW